jgi:hypothetical protein
MEWVEARPAGFAEAYFTEAELEWVAQAGVEQDWLVTAIWSAKEAALKAMRLGLTVDSRAVSCLVCREDGNSGELRGTQGNSRWELGREEELSIVNGQWSIVNEGWRPFEVVWDEGRLGQAGWPLQGWWRAWDGYVLTVAVGEGGSRWEEEWSIVNGQLSIVNGERNEDSV